MTASRVRIRVLDIAIFLSVLLIIGLISIQAYSRVGGTPEIRISGAGRGTAPGGNEGTSRGTIRGDGQQWIYPLDAETTVRVAGPLGETVVVIEDGTVRVIDSPCPEKICIKTGRISKPGQWIACLPNRVFISIRGGRSEQPDAISQ